MDSVMEEWLNFQIQIGQAAKKLETSSSAGVILLGSHTLKAYTRKRRIIARSSAEAVLYALAFGAV